MSILIKNMKMPKSCGDCPIGDSLGCSLMPKVPALWKEYTIAVRTNRRHSDCPLVPVPPHGRLIDEDVLFKEFERIGWFNNADRDIAEDALLDAPTIIEADA